VQSCGVCHHHSDPDQRRLYEIGRDVRWLLRHHPDPAPLSGWLLLDALRHLGGPMEFTALEAAEWGRVVQHGSQLVQQLTGCERVYAISFGEGARHLHLHLIPRFAADPDTEAWRVADLYRAVAQGQASAADPQAVAALVERGRPMWSHLRSQA
jgi:diadenosine tetraphosphate (Ap4A) HIT family hydrolase